MIDLSNIIDRTSSLRVWAACGCICISGWKYKHVSESVSYHSCTVNMLTPSIYFHQLHLLHFNRSAPAPLSLCSIPGFDLRNKDMMCPPERNALKEFYESTKGQEWTNDENWIDELATIVWESDAKMIQ